MRIANRKKSPLERRQRFSKSVLWKLQRNYYDRGGVDAWSRDGIPHIITSNPLIAEAYAKVVFGFLRDCHDAARAAAPIDPGQPFYIVELGSGHGRFGYLFLKAFLDIHRNSVLKETPVKYVMTDFTQRNLDHLSEHPWLRPFFEDGSLDVARFDIEHDAELRLERSGETLSAATLRNPLVVIANYVFDSVPQDAFQVEGGQLYEILVSLSSRREKDVELDDPEILSHLEISYDRDPVEGDYFDVPQLNQLLQQCRRRLPDASFLFPTSVIGCIQNFQRLSGGRMMLLSADKGYNSDEAILLGQGEPEIVMHASFSMMVDYNIIGEFFLGEGGVALHPAHRHQSINISAFVLGGGPGGHAETRQAYADAVETFGPDDFFTLAKPVEENYDQLTLEQTLCFLRLARFSHHSFARALPALKRHVADASELQKQELSEAVRRAWDTYFPIGEEYDLAFNLGVLLLEMQFYSEALEFFSHSAALYGMEPGTAYNMGVCHYSLRQMEQALAYTTQALELDPDFDAAKALRIKIQSAAGR